jgi:hypothetical protein
VVLLVRQRVGEHGVAGRPRLWRWLDHLRLAENLLSCNFFFFFIFFNSDPAARGTVSYISYLSLYVVRYFHIVSIAVRNNDWGNRLLQFYCVNRSILLYSREIYCRSFRHHRHHSSESSTVHSIRPDTRGGPRRSHACLVQRQAPLNGGPAGCVHTFIKTKVTVSRCVLVCTQLTCQCAASSDCIYAFLQNTEAVVRA